MTFETPRLPAPHRPLLQRLRSWFFTGLVVFGPLGLTVYFAWWLVSLIDNWVRPLAPSVLWPDNYLPMHVPGFGVIIAHCRHHAARLPRRQHRRAHAASAPARRCSTARRCCAASTRA